MAAVRPKSFRQKISQAQERVQVPIHTIDPLHQSLRLQAKSTTSFNAFYVATKITLSRTAHIDTRRAHLLLAVNSQLQSSLQTSCQDDPYSDAH